MRPRKPSLHGCTLALALALAVAPAFAGSTAADATAVSGTYLEARTSDIYTGPCIANGEVNVAGKEAVLAWKIEEGGFRGVPLAGLSVVAVVRANATLGDPFAEPASRSVLVVDERATPAQREALVAMARALSGELLGEVVALRRERVEMSVPGAGFGAVAAGDVAVVETRALDHHDHLCGNEEVYYPPLASGVEAMPAVTVRHEWNGSGLGIRWKSPDKRSAFVGTFTAR